MSERRRGEEGSGLLLAIATVGLVAALTSGIARVGSAASARASAQAAADAAALAGAAGGLEAVDEAAARNGATVTEIVTRGDDVLVTVDRGGVEARARARGTTVAIP